MQEDSARTFASLNIRCGSKLARCDITSRFPALLIWKPRRKPPDRGLPTTRVNRPGTHEFLHSNFSDHVLKQGSSAHILPFKSGRGYRAWILLIFWWLYFRPQSHY